MLSAKFFCIHGGSNCLNLFSRSCQFFDQKSNRTSTDKAIGSVHYISPEQAKGDITDNRADLYSVGVMLYEMLTGRLPFEAESAVAVAIKHIEEVPRLPRSWNPDIPAGLESIVMRAMQKDAADRYTSAAEMLRDIDSFKKDPSISFEYKYRTPSESTHEAMIEREVSGVQQASQEESRSAARQARAGGIAAVFSNGKKDRKSERNGSSRSRNSSQHRSRVARNNEELAEEAGRSTAA